MKYIIAVRILIDSDISVKLFEFKSKQERKSFIKYINKIENVVGYATTEMNEKETVGIPPLYSINLLTKN